ncbi:MAG: VanZ family protein [Clostridia bacterium]|nr:VanZ family protein [Clostridia bacterium]
MKIKIIRLILLLILLADMIFIAYNSAQDGAASSSASNSVTEVIAPITVPDYDKLDEVEKQNVLSSLNTLIREAAHLIQFIPIGFAGLLLLATLPLKGKIAYLRLPFTLAFGFLYALLDEIHQIFSPGRAFQFYDIGIDMLGVMTGCIAAFILLAVICFVKKGRASVPSENTK